MAFSRALEALRRNFGLVLVPVLSDLFSFLLVFFLLGGGVGRIPPDQLGVKFALPTIPPSISDVTEIDFLRLDFGAGGLEVLDRLGGTGVPIFLLLLVISFLVDSFVTGAFLGLLKDGLAGTRATMQGFFAWGRYFWKRFILLHLLLALVLVLAFVFLVPLLLFIPVLGGLLITLAFLVVAALLVFVEYALVEEDLEILPALEGSVRTVAANFRPVLLHILGVAAINLLASFLVNVIGRFSLLPAILLYAPVGTYGVFVLYCLYRELHSGGQEEVWPEAGRL
ncbi:MAG TPA: hypothetical protein GX518_03685 [Firmicutes bacterium]|nr:hypothetical protein [Bacillota bacterium]